MATISDNFQRLTGHDHLFLIKDFPVCEAGHDSRKDLVKVFVYRRVLVAEFLGLVEQVLAEEVAFDFDGVSYESFVFI